MDASFIIPAYNEQEHIADTIQSIRSSAQRVGSRIGRQFSYEIIVVNNGSTDQTVVKCRECGVHPVDSQAKTIGALRNLGVSLARGQVLVFLDGDVVLRNEWGEIFAGVFKTVTQNPMIISGAKVLPSDPDSFFARVWFRDGGGDRGYINSAHLIIHRELFEKLGGFDESLVAGEDSDISRRAAKLGGVITPVHGLKVTHYGSPNSIVEFFRRERWHGHGDFQTWRILSRSRPSHLAIVNTLAIILLVVGGVCWSPWILGVYPGVLGSLGVGSALHRTGYRIERRLVPLAVLYSVYIMARSVSLADYLLGFRPRRWR